VILPLLFAIWLLFLSFINLRKYLLFSFGIKIKGKVIKAIYKEIRSKWTEKVVEITYEYEINGQKYSKTEMSNKKKHLFKTHLMRGEPISILVWKNSYTISTIKSLKHFLLIFYFSFLTGIVTLLIVVSQTNIQFLKTYFLYVLLGILIFTIFRLWNNKSRKKQSIENEEIDLNDEIDLDEDIDLNEVIVSTIDISGFGSSQAELTLRKSGNAYLIMDMPPYGLSDDPDFDFISEISMKRLEKIQFLLENYFDLRKTNPIIKKHIESLGFKCTLSLIKKDLKPFFANYGFKKEKYLFKKTTGNASYDFSFNLYYSSELMFTLGYNNAGFNRLEKHLGTDSDSTLYHTRIITFFFGDTTGKEPYNLFFGDFFGKNNYHNINGHDSYLKFKEKFMDFMDPILSKRIYELNDPNIINSLINECKIPYYSGVKKVPFDRFYQGLIYAKISENTDLHNLFNRYIKHTTDWEEEHKKQVIDLYENLKKQDKEQLLSIFHEKNDNKEV